MSHDMSRRSFLQITALSSAAGAIMGTAAEAQAASGQGRRTVDAVGPDAHPLTLIVNGTSHTLSVEPRTTLAEALRGALHLTGTKIACNRGACSACTVWLDGKTVCACMMLATDVGARHITTIEGIAQGDMLHPVQTAFIEHDAVQCGFCTPGMVMSSVALLQQQPHPSADDVKLALCGHYCRCGTYPHVVGAVLAAAQLGEGKT